MIFKLSALFLGKAGKESRFIYCQRRLVLFLTVIAALCSATPVLSAQQSALALQPKALEQVGIYQLRQAEPNLIGTNVTIGQLCRSMTYTDGLPKNDYRPNIKHKCFQGKQVSFKDVESRPVGISPHATAIGSILVGDDPNGVYPGLGKFRYEGVVPDANLEVFEFWYFVTNNVFPAKAPDIDVLTISFGSQFEDWWTRGIGAMAEQSGMLVVAGIGNGSKVYDPVLYPGAGANVLGVGVVDPVVSSDIETRLRYFSLPHSKNSSEGPTGDGRCKPDIVAPGNCIVAQESNELDYEVTGSWSSYAVPIVAGTAGLLVQKAKDDPNLSLAVSNEGGNCVMKAILMNSATKLPYWHKGKQTTGDDHESPLDYLQGAGMLNAVSAFETLTAGRTEPNNISLTGWDNNVLETPDNAVKTYKLKVSEGTSDYITATLVWNKHYENKYPFEQVEADDHDLRLELWAVDPDNRENDYLLDYSDSRIDNVEHIYRQADANYTDYEIVVSYSEPNENADDGTGQRYGLAWSLSKTEEKKSIFWYDLNSDGIVNSLDFTIVANNFYKTAQPSQSHLPGDITMDGIIDFNDLQVLAAHRNMRASWYSDGGASK